MSKKYLTVIDADIARSSGTTDHPVSSGSRILLDAVSNNGHISVMSKELLAEWKKHRSMYAKKWLASMFARKCVQLIQPKKVVDDLIDAHISDEKSSKIAHKDSHLVDLSLESGKFIASNDDNARVVFVELGKACKILQKIAWVNAANDSSFIQDYFSLVTKDNSNFMLK